MKCLHCGFLCDFHESLICVTCRRKVDEVNRRVYILSLLSEAYPFVTDVHLREKIEDVIFTRVFEKAEA